MLGDVNIRIYTYIYTYVYKTKLHTDIINITYRLKKTKTSVISKNNDKLAWYEHFFASLAQK